MKKSFFIFTALIAIVVGAYFFTPGKNIDSVPAEENPEPVEIVLRAYGGSEVRLSSFRGTPVILNIWASWCPYCKNEFRDFAVLQEEVGDRVRIIAVNRGETEDVTKAYLDNLGLTGKLIFLLDPADSVYKKFGGFSMPETLFIDRDGFIKEHKRGPMDKTEMRRRIQADFQI